MASANTPAPELLREDELQWEVPRLLLRTRLRESRADNDGLRRAVQEALLQVSKLREEHANLQGKLTFIFSCAIRSQQLDECEVCAGIEESIEGEYPLWRDMVAKLREELAQANDAIDAERSAHGVTLEIAKQAEDGNKELVEALRDAKAVIRAICPKCEEEYMEDKSGGGR